jgi:hypothetical protein
LFEKLEDEKAAIGDVGLLRALKGKRKVSLIVWNSWISRQALKYFGGKLLCKVKEIFRKANFIVVRAVETSSFS